MRSHTLYKPVGWLAIVLMVWSVMAPLLTHAVTGLRHDLPGTEIWCTTVHGAPGAGQPDIAHHQDPAGAPDTDHCPYCFLHALDVVVPHIVVPGLFLGGMVQPLVLAYGLPVAHAPLWSKPLTRAPPR